MAAEWSLGRQSALWFGGLLAVLAAALVGAVYVVTLRYVASELDEEVLEVAGAATKLLDGQSAAKSIALLEMVVEENKQLDVLFQLRDGVETKLVGNAALLDAESSRFRRRFSGAIGDGRSLAVVIDGRAWERPVSDFSGVIAVLILGFVVVLLLASWWFGRKVSSLLRSVSRSVQESGRPQLPSGAPREIADVARAVSDEFDKLDSARARIQLLLAGAAHELRSPVQSMLSRVQVSMRRGHERDESLLDQEQDLVDLARKVDNLVLLAADTEDRLPMESFDWVSELDLRLRSDVLRARKGDVEVEFVGPVSLLIEGNRETLMLAVRNLVSNAVRFSAPGQRVLVTSAVRPDGLITVTVDDQGPGVAEPDRTRVFDALHRGRRHRGGYGLGLALVRRAMADHGGAARVEGSPLGGARFTLEFPSVREHG